jgi:catechol 2,3-dioxygenase-like lactoylglutathione lyase family enzyme
MSSWMFDHVELRSARFAESAAVFRSLLGTPRNDEDGLIEWEDFGYAEANAEHPPTENAHIGLLTDIEGFWRDGIAAGLRDDGAPGPRPQYRDDYVGAFLRDLDGNSIEACRHGNSVDRGLIDHIWLRVSDLGASRDFYTAIAPFSGFELAEEREGYALFRGPAATFSLIAGTPVTRRLHMAFPSHADSVVAAFHAAALAAGARDNGGPGERPEYHPGYVGAFVFDPDGNNVEVVNHNR